MGILKLEKHPKNSESLLRLSEDGKKQEKLKLLEPLENIDCSTLKPIKTNKKLKKSTTPEVQKKQEEGAKFIYCRVSSSKQKKDLERQVEYLSKKYKGYQVCKEIGSGINFKRKKLYSLLD